MALKFQIDKLEDVPAPLREHYVKSGDKYQLSTEGENPRVTEFRENNVRLMAEIEPLKAKLKQFEGMDPAAIAADKAKLAELDSTRTLLATREAELATTKAAHTKAQAVADASILKSAITDKFIKAGGRGNALDFMIAKATPLFDVVDGALVGKIFDPDKPGEKITPEGFVALQVRESDFAFLPSSGGGANPQPKGRSTGGGGVTVINNPTAQQLGEHAADVKAGRVRFEYDN